MHWREKVRYWLTPKWMYYSKVMDDFINELMQRGEFLGLAREYHIDGDYCPWVSSDYYNDFAVVNLKGSIYAVKISDYGTSDITLVYYVSRIPPHNMTSYLYGMRPSRKTAIRFWEWIEFYKPVYFVGGNAIIPGMSYDKNITEKFKVTLPEEEV